MRQDREGAARHGHRITAAIACHVARSGGTVDELTRLLLHPDHDGGRHAQHIALRSGQARALDYIRRVWASASAVVTGTRVLESRHHAYEVLAALRDRIETTPWRGERGRTALRVLRAHLSFAETAGGPLHHASERQTAEEAGISRTTLRAVYETVLKPEGWLRRLRVGHSREGSTWYLDHAGTGNPRARASLSRFWTTQYPPDLALEEWTTPETGMTADIDSTVVARLMGHAAFAHRGLGSSALMVIGALHVQPAQTVSDLVATASVSRATAYRTLRRLADHGLVHHVGETWTLAPRAVEGFGLSPLDAASQPGTRPVLGWEGIARFYGTAGTAVRRTLLGKKFEGTDHVFRLNGERVQAFSGVAADILDAVVTRKEDKRHADIAAYRQRVHAWRDKRHGTFRDREWGGLVSISPDGTVLAMRQIPAFQDE
ncbi:helix-turn-helix domain-containing protein [Streptomyces pseudovenezuelae]|uniref:HTH iclR-type domain-containing protein n=1 Tax=Streptomyces pseudovenezuelae TaxID=67350 RepID=A0ABT6LZY2_9ACTN|nr:helix-turn-helix domain-containing protein [Streptomyces pseudovenezuelae]MDH6221868.1 hypothetical protein [Streptomyces pseudovenezuelae]